MEVIFGLKNRKKASQGCVMSLGNFDGMHRGHQALLEKMMAKARHEKIPGGLMTFDPHPTRLLFPERAAKSIFDLTEKIEFSKNLGLDFFIVEPFSRELSELTPEEFFKTLLTSSFKLKFLYVGHDFRFGRNKSGTIEVLEGLCLGNGVKLEVFPPVKINGEIVSSTKIREAIALGEIEKANLFLGHNYFLKGVVERGAGRGKKIGFPTANLFTSAELFPRNGVYVTLFLVAGKIYHGVTNVGVNPTFNEKNRRPIQVETYILDFEKEIYGEPCGLSFLHYLRPEIKFESIDELIKKIKSDVEIARGFSWPKN
jgi:riboflavin kinase/FMN adenylyltransferase